MKDIAIISCGQCGEPLPQLQLMPGVPQAACPNCGSKKQHVKLSLFDSITMKVRDTLTGVVRNNSLPSKEKVRKKFFYGSDERKITGDYVYKEREIDRDVNRYRELVCEESGEVLRDIDEPLTSHTGHGTAKFKTKVSRSDGDGSES